MKIRLPRRRHGIDIAAGLFLAACGLNVTGASLAVTTTNDGGPDAALPEGGEPIGDDASVDATLEADADAGKSLESVVASGVGVTASGLSSQVHLFHADNANLYFAMWIEGTATVASASSPDLVTWTKGASLTLPHDHGGEGRVFSVGYRSIAGVDVVHIGIAIHGVSPTSSDLRHDHARATVVSGALVFGTVELVSSVTDSTPEDPDGVVTMIAPDGQIFDSSGWDDQSGPSNEVVYASMSSDMGTSWSSGFFGGTLLQVTTHAVNSKALVDVGSGVTLAIFEAADAPEPDPLNLRWSRFSSALTTSSTALFTPAAMHFGDWAVARVAANDVHLVRRTLAGTLEHTRYDGANWSTPANVPAAPTLTRTGLALSVVGSNVSLVAISSDASNAVVENRFTGGAWGTWKTIESTPHARTGLTTCDCGTAKPAAMYVRNGDLVVLPLSATP